MFSFFMNSFSTLGHSFFSSVNFLLVRDAAGILQGPAPPEPPLIYTFAGGSLQRPYLPESC